MKKVLDLKNYELKKIPSLFHDGLSKLFYELGIDGKEYVNEFINSYIKYTIENTKTSSEVYLNTGFGRRYIENHIKGIVEKNKGAIRNNHYILITKLQEISKKYKDGIIPIYGKYNTFNSAFLNLENSSKDLTSKSNLNKLIRIGFIEKVDEKNIKIISSSPTNISNDANNIIRILADNMNNFCSTLLHNLNIQEKSETLAQISYYTYQIKTDNHRKCTDELRKETRKYYRKCQKIIDSYEEKKELSIKQAEIENTCIGVSAFIYKN